MEKKLVEHLIEKEIASRKDIHRCVLRAAMSDGSVVDELIERIGVDEKNLAQTMAEYWGASYGEESALDASAQALTTLDHETARKYGALPLRADRREELICVAVYDVEKAKKAIEQVRQKTGIAPSLVVAPRSLVIQEIERSYVVDGNKTLFQPRETGEVLRKQAERSGLHQRPERHRANQRSGDRERSATPHGEEPAPTRQVDLTSDNPFMDLVAKSSVDSSEEPKTQAFLGDVDDFFDGFDTVSAKPAGKPKEERPTATTRPVRRVLPDVAEESNTSEQSLIDGALDAFDAELARMDETSKEDRSTSTVDWGESGSGSFRRRDTSGAGIRSPAQAGPRDPYDVEGSGIFPLDPEGRGFLGGDASEPGQDLTLAELVSHQKKQIDRLEREIEYQKGILQTMAELLIEARVLSRRKLKNRLKALKIEQKRKSE